MFILPLILAGFTIAHIFIQLYCFISFYLQGLLLFYFLSDCSGWPTEIHKSYWRLLIHLELQTNCACLTGTLSCVWDVLITIILILYMVFVMVLHGTVVILKILAAECRPCVHLSNAILSGAECWSIECPWYVVQVLISHVWLNSSCSNSTHVSRGWVGAVGPLYNKSTSVPDKFSL